MFSIRIIICGSRARQIARSLSLLTRLRKVQGAVQEVEIGSEAVVSRSLVLTVPHIQVPKTSIKGKGPI